MKLYVCNIVKLKLGPEYFWAEILQIDEQNSIFKGRILDRLLYNDKCNINDHIHFKYGNVYDVKDSILDY